MAGAADYQPRLPLNTLEKNLRLAPLSKCGRELLPLKDTRLPLLTPGIWLRVL